MVRSFDNTTKILQVYQNYKAVIFIEINSEGVTNYDKADKIALPNVYNGCTFGAHVHSW